MHDFLVLATDTDVGKTTFALLWMSALGERYAYWKPVETGPSDSQRVAELVPAARVHPPVARFEAAVAPPRAAKLEGRVILDARSLAACKPAAGPSLVETFGGPYSPLNDQELQLALVRELALPSVLVASSRLGAIGRTLGMLRALRSDGVAPAAVVLFGERDDYALAELQKHAPASPAFALDLPQTWDGEGIRQCAEQQREVLLQIERALQPARPAADWVDRDRAAVWHPYTSLLDDEPPLVCVGARDEFLLLDDGRKLIDGISSWWTIEHGHGFPPLLDALRDAAGQVDHVLFAGVTHPWGIELAELLLKTLPWRGGRAFYSDNGSTAVEVALKLAYQYWCHQGEVARTRFVGFEGGYHGDTFGAMAVSRDPTFFGRFEPLLFEADILPLDPSALDDHLAQQGRATAAVIVEPLVQGAGGMRMHSEQTLRDLAAVAARHEVLLIADEVMTARRLGARWAHQLANIQPDLVCAAKTLTGGLMPLAATLVSPKLVEAFKTPDATRTFFHGHSFTGHPLACAVALRNEQLWSPAQAAKAQRMEGFWRAALADLGEAPNVREVRVRGSIAAVELAAEGGYLAEVKRGLRRAALDAGVFLRPLGNVLYAMPPLNTRPASLQQIADAMAVAIEQAGKHEP